MSDLAKEVAELKAILRANEKKMREQGNAKGLQTLKALDQGRLPEEVALVLQGGSLNFSDEIGAMFGQGDFDYAAEMLSEQRAKRGEEPVSGYDINLSQIREPINQYRQDNPLKAMGYETAGAIGTSLATGGAGAALSATRAGNLLRAAPSLSRGQQALVAGTVAGAGSGESAEDRGINALFGGATGYGVQRITDMLSTPVRNLATAARSNAKTAREGRDQARRLMRDAIEADLTTPEEAITYVANRMGNDVTLADIGENTRVLIDALATLPGPAKSRASRYLSERQAGRPARLTGILQSAFGAQSRFYDDFMALKAARGKSANTLYGQAYKRDVPMNDGLRQFFQTDAAQNAYQRAIRIARNEDPKSNMDRFVIAESGDILGPDGQKVDAINTRFLHFMKMGIDDLAFPNITNQTGAGAAEVASVRSVRNAFIDEIDAANPMYARARNLYAGDSRMMDSLKRGREMLNADPDELAAEIAAYSKSEREAFRLGAMHALQDQMERSPETANVAQNMLKSPRRKSLLRLTFDGPDADDRFTEFMGNLSREANMARVEQAGMNSATAQRAETIRGLREQASVGGLPTSLQELLQTSLRQEGLDLQDRQLKATADELARMLTETDPNAVRKIGAELAGGRSLQETLSLFLPQNVVGAVFSRATSPMAIGNLTGSAPAYLEGNSSGAMDRGLNATQAVIAQ